jgi:hypothetical protein
MGIADDMRNLAEHIATSYDVRVKAFGQLVTADTHETLDRFSKEHEEMAKTLKDDLARGESERLKEFKALLKTIQERRKEREKEVADLLKRFQKEQKEMATALEDALAKGELVRKEDFRKMLKDIQNRQKEREREVHNLLKGFREEQERMASEWQKLTATMEEKRSGKKALPPKVAVEEVSEEEAVAMAEPIEVTPEERVKLEDRILDLIREHPEGIKLTEIAEEVGEARVKVGNITRMLIDEDKIRKEELLYFPV